MWDGPAIVGTVIGGLGLALAILSLVLQYVRSRHEKARRGQRLSLADQLAKGERLAANLSTGEPTRDFSDDEARITAWRDETIEVIRQARPEDIPFFQSDAGMKFYMSQYRERDRLRNYLTGRLERLGEILGRI
jgi:hypothetical protein